MTPELRAKLEKVTNLPSPPAVAAQVIDLAQQDDVHLAQVANAISCDASLAAKVMRVANSAMYARRRSSTNLRQALVVLGLHATVTLALGFSLMPLLQRSKDQHKMFVHTWRRSLMAGICARTVADVTRKMNAEEAFLSALLQDIGIMGIDRIFSDFYQDAVDIFTDHEAIIAFEREKLSADHAQIGAWLLRQWNLPEYLQDAVAVSHRLHGSRASDNSQNLSRCVGLSGLLADVWLLHGGAPEHVQKVARHAQKELGINSEQFARIMGDIGTAIPEMAHVFETELIDSEEARCITESAQEILTARSLESLQAADAATEKAQKLQSYADDLKQETERDALTTVASRNYAQELLNKGFSHATRFSWPLAVLFVDLDHFKKVNDTYGHQAGDTVLRNVGIALTDSVRCSDTVGRYGGEEFLVILPGADRDGVKIVAERLLNALRSLVHKVDDDNVITVTASIGCALIGDGLQFESLDRFVAAADEALYAAKNSGRDRYLIYQQQEKASADETVAAASVNKAPTGNLIVD